MAQDLERDRLLQLAVEGAEHHAQPPRPRNLLDLVAPARAHQRALAMVSALNRARSQVAQRCAASSLRRGSRGKSASRGKRPHYTAAPTSIRTRGEHEPAASPGHRRRRASGVRPLARAQPSRAPSSTRPGHGGAPLARASVTLTGRAGSLSAVTDSSGGYRFAAVDPGSYELRADLAGSARSCAGRWWSRWRARSSSTSGSTCRGWRCRWRWRRRRSTPALVLRREPGPGAAVRMPFRRTAVALWTTRRASATSRASGATSRAPTRCCWTAWSSATPASALRSCSSTTTGSTRCR